MRRLYERFRLPPIRCGCWLLMGNIRAHIGNPLCTFQKHLTIRTKIVSIKIEYKNRLQTIWTSSRGYLIWLQARDKGVTKEQTWPRSYKTCSTQLRPKFQLLLKTKIPTNEKFLALSLSDVVFIMLKMPTIVGILTLLSRMNFVLGWVEHGNVL